MKSLVDDRPKIAHVAHQIVVLDAGPSDTDCIHLLESVSADQPQRYLAGDHHDRRRIHVSVGDARDCVGRARPGCDQRYPHAPRSARIAFGHVHCALLVPHEVVSDAIARAPQLIVNVQHRAARITKDRIYAFMHEGLDQNLGPAR